MTWRKTTLPERLAIIKYCADRLESRQQDCAKLISSEMGKPIEQAKGEITKSIGLCHYYLENLDNMLTELRQPNIRLDPLVLF